MLAVDLRVGRTRRRLAPPTSIGRIRTWVAGLTGPGVLVLGQPLFVERGDPRFDHNLANYAGEYGEIAKALLGSSHDIVVLSGDVHFGRIASCRFGPGNRRKLVEVISSPLSLLSPLSAGAWTIGQDLNPASYPSIPVAGAGARPITYHKAVSTQAMGLAPFRVTKNHCMTLAFADQSDGSVEMTVRAWITGGAASSPSPLPRRDFTWSIRLG